MLALPLLAFSIVAAPSLAADFPIMAGLNVPWNQFGYDIGGGAFNATWFDKYFSLAATGGQNVARFWVHCDGARGGLEYSSDGMVKGISASFNNDLLQLLSIAQKHKVVVQLCLWSFDMCKDEMNTGSTKAHLISNEAATKSYVDNALKPMLAAVKSFPNAIVETINEPEWCIRGPGNTKDQVQASDMQRFVAMLAEAAHSAGRKVTTGSASLKWSSFASESEASYWDDASLKAAYSAASDRAGTMDFYNVHYYDWMYNEQWGYDPMRADTKHWHLDKPTVVAEIPPTSDHYSATQMLTASTTNGFQGVLFWAYNDPSFNYRTALAPLKNFATAHKADYEAVLSWLAAPAPAPSPPACDDVPPTGSEQYTCQQQKSWGKCSASFMQGFCCKTCFDCDPRCGKKPALSVVV